jgi:hypothetical protein
MFTSSSRGLSTKLWAVCGVLAIVSLSLVFAVGCASGGSQAQLQSGSAKLHTWNEAPADGAEARFFYSETTDDTGTAWNESRMVWCTEGNPPESVGKLGIETAAPPTFTPDSSGVKPMYAQITASAEFYVVNNWDRPISSVTASLPPGDLLYELPTGEQILAATFQGTGNSMYDWLLAGGGLFTTKCAPELFPSAKPNQVYQRFSTSLADAAPVNGSQDELLTTMTVTPPSDASIAAGAKSTNTGTVTLVFRGEGQSMARPVVALAFSTYFGVQLNFQY